LEIGSELSACALIANLPELAAEVISMGRAFAVSAEFPLLGGRVRRIV